MPSSWITPKARKGEVSSIAGRGLVATASIAAGEVVAVKGGHVVTTAALGGLPDYFSWYLHRKIRGLHHR